MLGYFGPEGTFTHQALLSLGFDEATRPYATVPGTLAAVRAGEVRAGVVPIENSVEGGVSATLDTLAQGEPLQIKAEILLPVVFGLYVRPGTTLAGVRRIITHSHAAAQVRGWISEHLPQATVTEQGSTAGAAKEVANPDSPFDAAICAAIAGDLYGLTALASGVADNADAVTRFVLVARPSSPGEPTGHDKTTIMVHLKADKPGGLMNILEQFALRGVNLCRIESRPEKDKMGNYFFSIDALGHIRERRMQAALTGLHRTCREVTFLGSYPGVDQSVLPIKSGNRDSDFAQSDAWLSKILG